MHGPVTHPRSAELQTTRTLCLRARRLHCLELETAGRGGHLNSAALHELSVDLPEAVIQTFHLKAPPPGQRPCHKTAHQGKKPADTGMQASNSSLEDTWDSETLSVISIRLYVRNSKSLLLNLFQ